MPVDFLTKLKPTIDKLIDEVWTTKAMSNDKDLVNLLGTLFESQVFEGYTKNTLEVDFTTPDKEMLKRLTADVWHFSDAKNYQMLKDFTLALTDENGLIRSFSDFKQAATGISDIYNKNWLLTEYNMAVGSSTMASQWVSYKKNAKTMPYLKYQTVGDKRVRPEHQALDGIIRKIDDSFWDTHYPPNGWGCRCDVQQLATSKAKETETIPAVEIKPMFQVNLAKQSLIFPSGHAYYNS